MRIKGSVSNEYGRIGIVLSKHGRIYHVYNHSPAYSCGLREGDLILSCDGKKGTSLITGISGTIALLEISRNNKILRLKVPRATRREVYDVPITQTVSYPGHNLR